MTASRDRVEAQRLRRVAERRARFAVVPSATVEKESPPSRGHDVQSQPLRPQPLRRPVERRAAVGPLVSAAPAPPAKPTPARELRIDPLLHSVERRVPVPQAGPLPAPPAPNTPRDDGPGRAL